MTCFRKNRASAIGNLSLCICPPSEYSCFIIISYLHSPRKYGLCLPLTPFALRVQLSRRSPGFAFAEACMIARPFQDFRQPVSIQLISLLFVTQAYSRTRNYCTGLSPVDISVPWHTLTLSCQGILPLQDWIGADRSCSATMAESTCIFTIDDSSMTLHSLPAYFHGTE